MVNVPNERLEGVLKTANRNITFTYLRNLYGLSNSMDFSGVPSQRIIKDNTKMLQRLEQEIEPNDSREIVGQIKSYRRMLEVLYMIPREDLIRNKRFLGGLVLLGMTYDEHFDALHDGRTRIDAIEAMRKHAILVKEELKRICTAWERRGYEDCSTSPVECVGVAESLLEVIGVE